MGLLNVVQPEHSPRPCLVRAVRGAQRVPPSDGLRKVLGLQTGLQLGIRPLPVASVVEFLTSENVRLGVFSVAQFRPFYALVMRRSGVRFSSQAPCLGPETPVWPTSALQWLDGRHRTRAFTGPLAASSLRRPGPGHGQAEAAQPVVCRRPSGARGRQAGGREEAGQSGGRRRARRVRRRRQRQKTCSPPAVGWPGARWNLPDEASPVRGPRCWRR